MGYIQRTRKQCDYDCPGELIKTGVVNANAAGFQYEHKCTICNKKRILGTSYPNDELIANIKEIWIGKRNGTM